VRLGYFGSYARGGWGVGSDVDLVAIVEKTDRPWLERALDWDTLTLPVPADLLVYTQREWDDALAREEPFVRSVAREVVWVYERA
jgi:predicted nucleotidyltransferase